MAETLALAKEISSISFPVLMVLILIGSYFEMWVWGKQHRKVEADLLARLAAEEKTSERWQEMALRVTGVAETQAEHQVRRGIR